MPVPRRLVGGTVQCFASVIGYRTEVTGRDIAAPINVEIRIAAKIRHRTRYRSGASGVVLECTAREGSGYLDGRVVYQSAAVRVCGREGLRRSDLRRCKRTRSDKNSC